MSVTLRAIGGLGDSTSLSPAGMDHGGGVRGLSIWPYKTGIGASFPWLGGAGPGDDGEMGTAHDARAHGNGGYFHFQPGEMYVGGGMWQMEKPRLDAFRAAVRDEPDRVRAALEAPAFVEWFGDAHGHEELKRFPPGFPQDHPLAHMFRWKDV